MATAPSFLSYLADWKNHLKLIGCTVLILASIWVFNTIRDLRAQLRTQQQISSTLQQKFQTLPGTTSAVAANSQGTQDEVQKQASDAFGSAITSAMAQQNATIQSLTTILGTIKSEQTAQPQQSIPAYTPQTEVPTTGKLTGYALEDQRNGKPPLSSISIFYDPSQTDPKSAFAGTTWTNYGEQFKTSVGDWQRQKDGGLRTTVKLTRTITKPDPADPTKTIQVGMEDIPLGDASTVYTPKGITASSPFILPRWTANLGISHSNGNGYIPAATIDYRLFDRYGLYVGAVNGAVVGGVSIRLGSQPK